MIACLELRSSIADNYLLFGFYAWTNRRLHSTGLLYVSRFRTYLLLVLLLIVCYCFPRWVSGECVFVSGGAATGVCMFIARMHACWCTNEKSVPPLCVVTMNALSSGCGVAAGMRIDD